MYAKYTETMKQFAIDEILKGHMDDNLAVIYDEVLDKGILTRELILVSVITAEQNAADNRLEPAHIVGKPHHLVSHGQKPQLASDDFFPDAALKQCPAHAAAGKAARTGKPDYAGAVFYHESSGLNSSSR